MWRLRELSNKVAASFLFSFSFSISISSFSSSFQGWCFGCGYSRG